MALVVAASGCGGSDGDDSSTQATNKPVPSSLGKVESSAEDIVDFARAEERSQVVAAGRELRRTAGEEAAAALGEAGVSEERITSLRNRARRVDELAGDAGFLDIALAANQVSALMPELYSHYSDPVPPRVLELDYLDREAQLRSLARERAGVIKAVVGLSSTWARLRPDVGEAGGASAADEYSRHVAAMRRLVRRSDQSGIRREAVRGLALVDVLEGVFRRSR